MSDDQYLGVNVQPFAEIGMSYVSGHLSDVPQGSCIYRVMLSDEGSVSKSQAFIPGPPRQIPHHTIPLTCPYFAGSFRRGPSGLL